MKPAPGYEEAAKKFDPDHPHCRECVCAGCLYFYHNRRGDCLEGCYVCDQESHTGGCGMFEPLGGGGMEQLTFGLDSTEERELVLPPTKAQRLLAVLNAAIVRSGCEYGTVPYWPPFDRGDYGNMNYVGEARSEPTSTHATPGIRPT